MKSLLNNLLVAVDFSVCSEKALRFASEWAVIYGSKVVVLHVINDSLSLEKIINKDQESEFRKGIEGRLLSMVQDIFDPNISFQIVLEKGKVYEKVCEAALIYDSGVVLMGCNSSAEKNSRYIGSNTLRTMRTCTIPVVIITAHTKTLAIESVIFPVDLAKDYTQKLHWAVRFTNLGKGVRLNLVSVLKDNDGFVVNRMAQQLTNAKEELLKLGVPHTAEIIKASGAIDNVSEIVTDYAQKLEASLIFIMTQPESTYTPYYVSSIVQEIIALSRIPVMAVTPVPVRQKVKIKN